MAKTRSELQALAQSEIDAATTALDTANQAATDANASLSSTREVYNELADALKEQSAIVEVAQRAATRAGKAQREAERNLSIANDKMTEVSRVAVTAR